MTLNINDLQVTSFEPVSANAEEAIAPRTQGCPIATVIYTQCQDTCYTCAVGCQTGGGYAC